MKTASTAIEVNLRSPMIDKKGTTPFVPKAILSREKLRNQKNGKSEIPFFHHDVKYKFR